MIDRSQLIPVGLSANLEKGRVYYYKNLISWRFLNVKEGDLIPVIYTDKKNKDYMTEYEFYAIGQKQYIMLTSRDFKHSLFEIISSNVIKE